MFEGSDLSVAYGFDQSMDGSGGMMGGGMYGQGMQAPQGPAYPPPPMVQQAASKPPVKQMVSVQQPGDVPYQPPEAMYTHTKPVPVAQESFFERIASKRFEVFKVVAFAFIILFAISMDRFFTFYLSQYISQSILTTTQEILVRASYPVAVLLMIWFIKAM